MRVFVDLLGVLGEECSDLGLCDDGRVQRAEARVGVEDRGGDAVEDADLKVVEAESGHDVGHRHLRRSKQQGVSR